MATSRIYRKEDYPPCSKCGKSVENMSRTQQDEHEEFHRLETIEESKQQKLF